MDVEDYRIEEEEEESIDYEYENEEAIDQEFEEVEELEEITPRVLRWMANDGKTMHGIKVIDADLNNPMNKCQLDFCPICYEACASQGHHQIWYHIN